MEVDGRKVVSAILNDKYAWLLVIAPIIGLLFELIAGQDLIWIYFLLNIIFFSLDYKELKTKNVDMPHVAWVVLIPVYLWKRAILLNQDKHYFWGWIGVFILSLTLSTGGGQQQLEDTAMSLVTEILQDELGADAATCIGVKIDDYDDTGLHSAIAILDNGNVLDITITEVEGGRVFVNIPYDQ